MKSVESDTLIMLDKMFNEETARKGIEGWVVYFAENGSMVSGTSAPITGREAIRRRMTPVFGDSSFSLRWEPTRAEMLIVGKLGFTIGRSVRKRRNAMGSMETQRGIYATLWMKQPDQSWKIILDTGSDEGPAVQSR